MDEMNNEFDDWDDDDDDLDYNSNERYFLDPIPKGENGEVEKIDLDEWIDNFLNIIKKKIDESFDDYDITGNLFYCQITDSKLSKQFTYLDIISHPKIIQFNYKNCYFEIDTPTNMRTIKLVVSSPYFINKD